MEEYSILVVASNRGCIQKVRAALPCGQFNISTAQNGYVALEKASCYSYDAVVVAFPLPLMQEREFLGRLARVEESLPVLALSPAKHGEGGGEQEHAELVGLSSGQGKLGELIERAVKERALRSGDKKSSRGGDLDGESSEIIGCGAEMRKVLKAIVLVKDGDIPVLLEGESGTGKDLVAKTIHFASRRRDYPFVPVNCVAIPDALLESELFGHEKGAFTGAVTRRIGKFEQANRGTLFLDEIAEMSRGTQAKLLRAIETREIERIGGSKSIQVNIRIISATNQDLYRRMEQGDFRRDLYYRVAAFRMVLPPLRDRTEDIPVLATHFLSLLGARNGKLVTEISPAAMKILLAHDWKGNVRELINVIHRACVLCSGDTVHPEHLPPEMIERLRRRGKSDHEAREEKGASGKIVPLWSLESQAMKSALKEASGNVSAAARGLKMGRATFYRKAQKYEINLKERN